MGYGLNILRYAPLRLFYEMERDSLMSHYDPWRICFGAQPFYATMVCKMMPRRSPRNGFTLIELLVVIAIIVLLAALAFPAYQSVLQHGHCAGCATRMRGLGIAFVSYANDNDGQLPGRVQDVGDKWPLLLLPYVGDPKSYVDPGDSVANKIPSQNLLSNSPNNSSFFFNGFNDLGAYTNPNQTVRLVNLNGGSNLIILGQKTSGAPDFYMDFVENNENEILNKTAYYGGSNYTFADGSVRYMTAAEYSDRMWLVNQSYQIP
jgi:prepilin-type N-terminal cleavage/methylation domain-containing protein/prepilin-type processing-associated H-X9-DG protein